MATPPARTAGQRPLVALLATAVLAAGGVQLVGQQDPSTTDGTAARAPAEQPVAPEPGRAAQVVGPVRGADVSEYVDGRLQALDEAPEGVDTAVVSFTDRVRVDDAVTLVEGREVRAVLLRLPLSTAGTTVVRVEAGADPVVAVQGALARTVEPLRAELGEVQQLLDGGTVGDDAFVREYEQRAAALQDAIAAADGASALVHAVVVRAPLEQLQALRGQTGIRLVDPAPPGTDASSSVFTGLLPSDSGTVSEGRAA